MAGKAEMCSSAKNELGVGIVQVKIKELCTFKGHPFKVERNQELFELRRSIEAEGVLVPLLVRQNPYGKLRMHFVRTNVLLANQKYNE